MLATHNSGTGEKGYGWWSFLYAPFAKCHSKTLVEQFREGVRLFDIRVRKRGDKWVFAHGLWESEDVSLDVYKYFGSGNSVYADDTIENGITYSNTYTE